MFFVVHEVIRVWWQSWLRVSANAGFRPIIYLARDNSSLALCIEHHPSVRAGWLFLIEAWDWSADPECRFLIGPKLDKTGHSQGQQQLLFTRPHFGSHHPKITESHKNIYFNLKTLKSGENIHPRCSVDPLNVIISATSADAGWQTEILFITRSSAVSCRQWYKNSWYSYIMLSN